MDDILLIPLPGFALPSDFPVRTGFVGLVNDQLKKLRCIGHFVPPRFFGYYFQGKMPTGIAGSWSVVLDDVVPISYLPDLVAEVTMGQFSIASLHAHALPDFILVHDRHDRSCCLWSFAGGLRFVEASEPTYGGDSGAEQPKLLGP